MTTRRAFVRLGAAASAALTASAKVSSAAPDAEKKSPRCLDYGASFVCNTAAFNSVRMWIESRTTIMDSQAGTRTEYYQCGSCKSEDTFPERNLFLPDNYDFLPIFSSDGKRLIFRRHATARPGYRQVKTEAQAWGPAELKLRAPAVITELDTWEKIRDATAGGLPIVTQTTIENPDTGLSAIIECPVKTMNIRAEDKKYQTDTGPIALPDLGKRYDPQIECLSLAFIAFNAPGSAEFVVETETPVMVGGNEVSKVFHYSKLLSLPVSNRILALGTL